MSFQSAYTLKGAYGDYSEYFDYQVAEVLRCSRAHVQKALGGKIAGVPQLAYVNMGRRNWCERIGSNSGWRKAKPLVRLEDDMRLRARR
ncbi:MAG: hypothetical protein JWO80_4919 [Bryobacterales bacterium]|nr:hypothetical protein [Bryobacterales bacterium]